MNLLPPSAARLLAAVLFCLSWLCVPTQAAAYCTDSPVDGAAYKIINVGSDKLLEVASASTTSGANIDTSSNNGGSNQRFYVHYQSSSHYWTIVAAHSSMLVDVASASTSNGANVIQATASGATSQEWELKLQSDSTYGGSYRIVNRNSSASLTVLSSADGANVYQNSDASLSSQRWWLEPVTVSCSGSSSSGGTGGTVAAVTGFASQSGSDGLSTTTGGSGGSTVTVTSCSALKSALSSSTTQTVQIPDNTTIDCRTSATAVSACVVPCPDYQDAGKTTYRIPTSSVTCDDLDATGTATVYRYDQRLSVASNKTLIGLGSGSAIQGASLILSGSENVIIANLTITNINPHLIEAGDGITVDDASHVLIDHVAFSLISDGHVDISDSQNVTLSYNHFDGINSYVCGSQHWYTNAVDDSQVTFHDNFWDYTAGRNPKITGSSSRVHLYNNYWLGVTYFSVGVDDGAQALLQADYFDDAARPHWNQGSGYINGNVSTNVYTGQSASGSYAVQDTGSSVFSDVSLYSYSLEDVDDMTDLVNTTGPQ